VAKGSTSISITAGATKLDVAVEVVAYAAGQRALGKTAYDGAKCADCHTSGPDITPSGIGKHSDDEILGAAMMGKNPEGGNIAITHAFSVGPEIVAYLRSQPPRDAHPMPDMD